MHTCVLLQFNSLGKDQSLSIRQVTSDFEHWVQNFQVFKRLASKELKHQNQVEGWRRKRRRDRHHWILQQPVGPYRLTDNFTTRCQWYLSPEFESQVTPERHWDSEGIRAQKAYSQWDVFFITKWERTKLIPHFLLSWYALHSCVTCCRCGFFAFVGNMHSSTVT